MNRQRVWGPVFLSPAIILLVFLYIVPLFYSVYLSFYEVGFVANTWAGLGNYRALMLEKGFWDAARVTTKFIAAYLFFTLVIAYVLGLALCRFGVRFRGSILTLYYIPSIFAGLATVIAWRWFFRYPDGGLNSFLSSLGLPGVSWFGNPTTAAWAICLILGCSAIGSRVLLYVIGISQINQEILEAARIDGANEFQIIRYIITPLTHRVRLYLFLISLIAATSIWEHPFFFTSGGPLGSTTTIMYKIYHKALIEGDLGIGSALTTIVVGAILFGSYIITNHLREFLG